MRRARTAPAIKAALCKPISDQADKVLSRRGVPGLRDFGMVAVRRLSLVGTAASLEQAAEMPTDRLRADPQEHSGLLRDPVSQRARKTSSCRGVGKGGLAAGALMPIER